MGHSKKLLPPTGPALALVAIWGGEPGHGRFFLPSQSLSKPALQIHSSIQRKRERNSWGLCCGSAGYSSLCAHWLVSWLPHFQSRSLGKHWGMAQVCGPLRLHGRAGRSARPLQLLGERASTCRTFPILERNGLNIIHYTSSQTSTLNGKPEQQKQNSSLILLKFFYFESHRERASMCWFAPHVATVDFPHGERGPKHLD